MESDKEQPVTLKQFVDDNQKLISVLGIFTALMLFSYTMIGWAAGVILNTSLFTCQFLLWIELLAQFPKKDPSIRLMAFRLSLYVGFGFIAFIWLLFQEAIVGTGAIGLIAIIAMISAGMVLSKIGWLVALLKSERRADRVFSRVIVMVVLAIVVTVTGVIGFRAYPRLHRTMAGMRQTMPLTSIDSLFSASPILKR